MKNIHSFYLKSKENCYRIDCKNDTKKLIPITKAHTLDSYIKNKCNYLYKQASCWIKAVYYTSRPDKLPFEKMYIVIC